MKPLPNPDPEAGRVEGFLSLLLDQFRTDVPPNASWRRRWYDRAVRAIGALILIAILAGMVYVALTRNP